MNIYLVAGSGEGKTTLAAFDNALLKLGVHNYNYLVLSSVIPPKTTIVEVDKYVAPSGQDEWGHKLYAVKADVRSDKQGLVIGAGIGWYQGEDGRGVFVEHHAEGVSESDVEASLKQQCTDTVTDIAGFRNLPCKESDVKMKTCVKRVTNKPACAVVIAVFKAEGWE